jgi:hypothetical protein
MNETIYDGRDESDRVDSQVEMWAIVELMGHGRTAGIMRTSDLGGLLRVDVPIEEGFRTEYYGESAIYSIKVVSEEIARAYALPQRDIVAYDEPIVPRAEYERALEMSRRNAAQLQHQVNELQQRLTAVRALPAGPGEEDGGREGAYGKIYGPGHDFGGPDPANDF